MARIKEGDSELTNVKEVQPIKLTTLTTITFLNRGHHLLDSTYLKKTKLYSKVGALSATRECTVQSREVQKDMYRNRN